LFLPFLENPKPAVKPFLALGAPRVGQGQVRHERAKSAVRDRSAPSPAYGLPFLFYRLLDLLKLDLPAKF
jgi:hypothetical protein